MLTLSSGEQIIYQTDSRTVTASGSTTQETQTVFRQPGGSEKEPAVLSTVYQRIRGRSSSATARSAQASVLRSHRLYRASQGSEAIKSRGKNERAIGGIYMKIWKRNAIIASVLLLVCAGVYLNWSKAQKTDVQDLTEDALGRAGDG